MITQTTARPNILMIMTDQQQYATAGPAAPGRSPALERLAAEGIWFRRAYTATTPCSPARASIVTGLYPHANGMLNNCHVPYAIAREIRPECATWGNHLSAAGYRMRYVGKWHVGWRQGPADLGFDSENRQFDAAAYRRQLGLSASGDANGATATPAADEWGFTDAGGLFWRHYGREAGPPAATGTAAQAAAGLEQLRALTDEPDERPWFLWTNFSGPHNPYLVPEPYASLYDWRDVPLPASYYDAGEGKPAYVRRVRESWFGEITEEHTRKSIAHYWGYCTMIDHFIGKLLAFLDESGQAEHTLVVFTSDHGDMMGAHGLWFKDVYPYEETHRMPLLMRWPGMIAPGSVCDTYARTLDLGPTYLEVAGARPLASCHGRSLLPVLTGAPDAASALERRELFMEDHGNIFNFTQRQLLDGRYKFVFNAFDFDELYDLDRDPHELHNLAYDRSHRATYERLADRLWDWMLMLEDPYSGRPYAANVLLTRSSPPPLRPDPRPPTTTQRGVL